MDKTQRLEMLAWTIELARRVGREALLPRMRLGSIPEGLRSKGARDFVTEADESAERMICEAIRARCPDHAIVAEEHVCDEHDHDAYRWYVDPLDGTTNFVHGLPMYSTSLACYGPQGPEVGVVYAPYLDECFYAARDCGAFLNNDSQRLQVARRKRLSDSILVSGFAYDREQFPNTKAWSAFLARAGGLRRFGSAAIDLCYVAAGRLDGMWERGLNPYDCAAGALMVQEAGGLVTDYQGGDNWLLGRRLVAANTHLHAQILGVLDQVVEDG